MANDVSMNIQLAGFGKIDSSSMIVVNNNIKKHARRIEELAEKTANLHITLKLVHERERSEIYEIRVKVTDGGKIYASHASGRNLFIAIDKALQKVINEMD